MQPLSSLYDLPDEAATRHLARRLSRQARRGDVLCLYGALGAGKTVLARAFVRSLCGANMEVPSPTYTLMQVYEAPDNTIVHADMYRLEDPDEVIETGILEQLEEAITLIEWPQNMGRYLPEQRLDLSLEFTPADGRQARLSGHGRRWQSRLGNAA